MKLANMRLRRAAVWALSIGLLASAGSVEADPVPNPFPTPAPRVFCFRVTDIEGHPTDPNRFKIQVEFLNWTSQPAYGSYIWTNTGTTTVVGGSPRLIGAGVDPDGRGGEIGGQDIGPGIYNIPAHHSGRGRGDIPGHQNNWSVVFRGPTSVYWGGEASAVTPIPFRPIMTVASSAAQYQLVPGLGNDGLLTPDSAVDGGPAPYGPPTQPAPFPAGGPPSPDGSANVLDGFWIEVEDFNVGEVLSMNWMLANASGQSIGQIGAQGNVVGDEMGFGVLNLTRITPGGALPPGVFLGNSGFEQGVHFYQNVYLVPDPGGQTVTPAEFGVEFGPSLMAPPQSPDVATEVPTTVPPTITVPSVDPAVTPPNAEPAVCSLLNPADVNESGVVNVADIVCIVLQATYELAGSAGPAPGCFTAERYLGDLNCDDDITVADAQLAIHYAFSQPLPIQVDGNGNGCHDSCDCSADLCDDYNACTIDQCSLEGGCQNLPVGCDDGNPCTTDSCSPSQGCVFAPVGCGGAPGCTIPDGTACSDGTVCTIADVCSGGSCVGSTLDCNDHNPCTVDACDPFDGCEYTNVPDGTTCDTVFQCVAGTCVQPTNCTVDADCNQFDTACKDFGCVNTSTPGVNQCSVVLTTNCNDNNPCTDDSCDAITGCLNVNDDTNDCDDGNVCTIGDSCQSGTCFGTGGLCDDSNDCTIDFCSPNTGCFGTPRPDGTACTDGSVCTEPDACTGGFCGGPAKNCDDGNACTADSCHPVNDCQNPAIDCNDSNPCTDDSCDPGSGCIYVNNTVNCDDGSVCTDNDICGGGTCAGTPIDCTDDYTCTVDGCNSTTGCTHSNSHSLCNDNVPCTADSCNPLTGATGTGCINAPNNNLCGDGEFCTDDICTATGCQYPNNDGPCDDGDVCTVGDACVAGLCVPGPDLCVFGNLQGNEFCHVAGDANDVFDCTIRVARATTDTPPAAGVNFTVVNPAPALIEIDSIQAENCAGGGGCVTVTLPGNLETGHVAAINPSSFTQWNGPTGGTVLVYDPSPPHVLTTAHVDFLGNPVGDAVVLTMKVRVKANIDAETPVKLEYQNIGATTTQGSDMQVDVQLGTIVVDYTCPLPLQDADSDGYPETCPVCEGVGCLELDDVFCFVSGSNGASVDCPIEVVRRDAASPPIGGVQYRLDFPANSPFTVTVMEAEFCLTPGVCFPLDYPSQTGGNNVLSSGHQVAAVPADYASWPADNGADVLIYGSGTPDSVSDAYLDGTSVTGDSEVFVLRLSLTDDVPAATPLKLRLRNLSATSPLGSDLEAVAEDGRIVVGVPQSQTFCEVFGDVNDVTTCYVRVARQTASTPIVGGVQFTVPIFDPEAVEVVSLTAIKCLDGVQCFEVLMPDTLDTGHQVSVQPTDYSEWDSSGGGGVLAFGGTTQSPTTATLSSSGQLVGNSEMMRLKVKLKQAFTPQAPLQLSFGSVAATTADGTDLDARVLNGTILIAEEQNDILGEVSGVAGQLLSLPIRLARANASVPSVAGVQFSITVDNPSLVEIVSLTAEVCVGANCTQQVMPYPLDTGNLVSISPSNYANWASTGHGQVLIYGGTTQSLTDAVLGAGGSIQGDAEFMSVNVRLTQSISSSAPERVHITPLGASDSDGFDLVTSLLNSVMVVE